MKTTSVALGPYFENFIKEQIALGRYNNASEVIRAALRTLEDEERQLQAFNAAVQEGIDSGLVRNFDPAENLKRLKEQRYNG